MIYGMNIHNQSETPAPIGQRVLVWSHGKWKPAKWEPEQLGGRLKAGMFLDCGTGPVEFSHWVIMPPSPED